MSPRSLMDRWTRLGGVLAMALSIGPGGCHGVEFPKEVSQQPPTDPDGGADGGADIGATIEAGGAMPDAELLPVANVVITEIMYHPVYEQSDIENHEFVEIYNRGTDRVALGHWSIRSKHGVAFAFPDDARLDPGSYAVVAKNREMLGAVYPLAGLQVLGDYQGELDNGKDTVTLADETGKVVDAVAYDDAFPWPMSADAFGVSDDWLPATQLPLSKHQYKGRSLERISADGPPGSSGWPANWDSSPLDRPTPGKANAMAGTMLPIVEECSTCPGGPGAVFPSGQPVTLRARFSAFAPVEEVQLEYYVDDLVRTPPLPKTIPMTADADGSHSVVLPDVFKDNDLIRYRIRARRDGKAGIVGPRASDPMKWYSAFVAPKVFVKPGVETKERVYHLWLRPADWTQLEKFVAPGRAGGDRNCTANPSWNLTVPATFAFGGNVYDVRVRYEGGRWNRGDGLPIAVADWPYPRPNPSGPDLTMDAPLRFLSWMIKFPSYQRFEGTGKTLLLNKMHQGSPGVVSAVEGALLEKAGVPTYRYTFARLHIDGGYYGYVGQPEAIDDAIIKRAYPGEAVGDLFKDIGLDPGSRDGPIGRGDFFPLDDPSELCPGFKEAEYYAATYERKNYEHRSHDDIIKLIKDLDVARRAGAAAVKSYFDANWDIDGMVRTYVIRKWAGAWDDWIHNIFPYKRPSGKWIALQQDFEWDLGLFASPEPHGSWGPSEPTQTLYLGYTGFETQLCELTGVKTPAEAQERGCSACHGTARAAALVLPTQVTTPADAVKLGCHWGGLPALANLAEADQVGCTGCHATAGPKKPLVFPTTAYTGAQAVALGCRAGGTSSLMDAFIGTFKADMDKMYCALTKDGTLSADGVIKLIDDAAAHFSLDDWMSGPAVRQYCADVTNTERLRLWDCRIPEAHEAMRLWARTRYKTVMQRLKCQ